MRILLTTLNAKYIHSNLALRYLKEYCRGQYENIFLKEFTINDTIESIISEIVRQCPDVIGFSCYIWNIEEILRIVTTLKKIIPETIIILGGPEVSFDPVVIMEKCSEVDFILTGEGEQGFLSFLDYLHTKKTAIEKVSGLAYRGQGSSIIENPEAGCIADLNSLPNPYSDGYLDVEDRIIYYESSRGCPFQCQYCLSSIRPGVRFLPVARVKKELKQFVAAGVKQVKLVDRTFNADPARAREIFSYLISLKGETNFHFEMAAHLIDDKTLEILKNAPPGLFQFEIGIQSTNEATLGEIKRKTDLQQIKKVIDLLMQYGNIHIHVDLIAGLPEEGYASFRNSFEDVAAMKPDRIQLGFLKLLKGSGLREHSEKYGYVFSDYPPYEVFGSKDISYFELQKLKGIEDLLERYGNSHRYDNSLNYLNRKVYNHTFDLYEAFWKFWEEKGYYQTGKSVLQQFGILYEFGMTLPHINEEIWKEIIKFDYLADEKKSQYLEWMSSWETKEVKEKVRWFYRCKILDVFPDLAVLTSRQLWKKTHVELFPFDIIKYVKEDKYFPKPTYVFFDYINKKSPQSISTEDIE